jgi:hypothetical protein
MSDMNLEQRINIEICVKIGKSASETIALLTLVYSEYAMMKSNIFEWHWQFKKGREVVQDDAGRGQPKTQRTDAYVDKVETLVRSDRRLSVRLIVEGYRNIFGGKDPNSGLTSGSPP